VVAKKTVWFCENKVIRHDTQFTIEKGWTTTTTKLATEDYLAELSCNDRVYKERELIKENAVGE
jgi:hypothetical protein